MLVTVEYDVEPADRAAFHAAIRELGRIRLRDGAIGWGIFQDAAEANHDVENFLVADWAEHLRQHERVMLADREVEKRVKRFHRGPKPPAATHWLGPEEPGATK